MTDRMATLRKLETVARDGSAHWSAHDVRVALGANHQSWFLLAKQGSLDAAHSLHNAVLPGWWWTTAADANGERWFCVGDSAGDETDEIYDEVPARAWLRAIICALIIDLEAEDGDG